MPYGDKEREFVVPASDTKGHSHRLTFRLQPGHSQQVETLIGAKRFPYRNKSDLIRHATVRHLVWLEAQGGEIPSVLRQVDVIMEIMRREEFVIDFDAVFERMRRTVGSHIAANRNGAAKRLLLDIRGHIEKMPDSLAKDDYMEKLEDEYGHLLQGVRLLPAQDQDVEVGIEEA